MESVYCQCKWFKLKGGGGRVEHIKPAMLHRSLGGCGSVVLQTNVIYCCQRRGFFRVAYETLQRTDWLLCYTCSAALSILRAACVASTSSFFSQHHNSYSADTVLVTYVCVCALPGTIELKMSTLVISAHITSSSYHSPVVSLSQYRTV